MMKLFSAPVPPCTLKLVASAPNPWMTPGVLTAIAWNPRPTGSVRTNSDVKFAPVEEDVASMTGAAPETVTSAEAESDREPSTTTVLSSWTAVFLDTDPKPEIENVTEYSPGGSREIR